MCACESERGAERESVSDLLLVFVHEPMMTELPLRGS